MSLIPRGLGGSLVNRRYYPSFPCRIRANRSNPGGKYKIPQRCLLRRYDRHQRATTAEKPFWKLAPLSLQLDGAQVFKLMPDLLALCDPGSMSLKRVQPQFDDLLFLGKSYEAMFDRFEIMLALVHADLLSQSANHVWGPFGRFAWKHRGRGFSIYASVLKRLRFSKMPGHLYEQVCSEVLSRDLRK